jgi:hypothetical protein
MRGNIPSREAIGRYAALPEKSPLTSVLSPQGERRVLLLTVLPRGRSSVHSSATDVSYKAGTFASPFNKGRGESIFRDALRRSIANARGDVEMAEELH